MWGRVARRASWILVLGLALGVGGDPAVGRGAALTTMHMQQAFLPDQEYLPYLVALDQGYYAARGIALINHAGSGSGTSTKLVGAGSMQVGMGGTSVVMQAIAAGLPLTIILTHEQQDPSAVCALRSSGITTPRDLVGKRVATSPGNAVQQEMMIALQQQGIGPRDIHWVNISPTAHQTALLAGRVDAITCSLEGSAVDMLARGLPITSISVASLGLRVPLEAVFVRSDYLSQHRDLVRAFTRATLQGLRYATAHPAEAAAALRRRYPQVNVARMEKRWQSALTYFRSPVTDRQGIGWNDDAGYRNLMALLIKGGQLTQPLDLNTVYTNSVLQSIPLEERRNDRPH